MFKFFCHYIKQQQHWILSHLSKTSYHQKRVVKYESCLGYEEKMSPVPKLAVSKSVQPLNKLIWRYCLVLRIKTTISPSFTTPEARFTRIGISILQMYLGYSYLLFVFFSYFLLFSFIVVLTSRFNCFALKTSYSVFYLIHFLCEALHLAFIFVLVFLLPIFKFDFK